MKTGEIILTVTGRRTSPIPKIDISSNRKAINTLNRLNKWLVENSIEEAKNRGDDYNLKIFENENIKNLPPASKILMEKYLFGRDIQNAV